MQNIRKFGLVIVLAVFAVLAAASVSAWYSVDHEVEVNVSGAEGAYWVDVLAPCEAAPILTPAELAERLPEEYLVDPYLTWMNGILDLDGYASVRLYTAGTTRVYDHEDGAILFHFTTPDPASYKIAVIAADGAIQVSDVITQTMFHATITFQPVFFSVVESSGFERDIVIGDPPLGIPEVVLFIGGMVALCAIILLLLCAFGYRSHKTFLVIGLFNTAVIVVVIVLLTVNQLVGSPLFAFLTMLLIALAVFGQMTYLALNHPEMKPTRALAFALVANLMIATTLMYFQSNFLWYFDL